MQQAVQNTSHLFYGHSFRFVGSHRVAAWNEQTLISIACLIKQSIDYRTFRASVEMPINLEL